MPSVSRLQAREVPGGWWCELGLRLICARKCEHVKIRKSKKITYYLSRRALALSIFEFSLSMDFPRCEDRARWYVGVLA
jgi:hypothetical protein